MNAHLAPSQPTAARFDVARVRADFPILARKVHGKPLVYADNAATTQKPTAVIERLNHYYAQENANIHRGVHTLSAEASAAHEAARETVQRFINARESREVVFTRGTTESINLVAQTWGRRNLRPGDEVLISALEHHANIVPWQMICADTGAALKVAPITDAGEIDLAGFDAQLSAKTRLLAVAHISNALGTINPVAELIARARAVGALTLVDGAQSIIHAPVDVQALGCDFFAFSGHKALGPTGIGVLYGRAELLEAMPPYQGGGDMIKVVRFEGSEYNDIPYRFEAGTPHIAGALGLAAALDYFAALDLPAVLAHEDALLAAATERARRIAGLRIVGQARHKAAVLSFDVEGVHPQDLGTLLDLHGVAIRTGHHCAMPVMTRYGLAGTARASFALYNTLDEVHAVFDAVERVLPMLKG
ncbi:MAG: SufS family cysteine desulfurase [Gammaproteobacteria bacterium]|nr:SufS family cysteine desulfurase [Gammaproteobacteria bacterium]